MKKKFLILLLIFCTSIAFSQDNKVMKIVKYIDNGKGSKAKEILDELDTKPEYQSDIYYWYVRTIYYRNVALENVNSSYELTQARQSFVKLVEFDKKDLSKTFTEFIPQIKKDLYEGKNQATKSESNTKSATTNQGNDEKTVTLTQIGEGRTKDKAKYNALRNALEQAFGTFISSNTTLLNDEFIKDEIVSISSGNIQNFEILSETQMPDGSFSSVVKATVSIGNFTKFCESKGITAEFKGGLFTANIKLQELNKKNESAVVENLSIISEQISKKCFDFTISVGPPVKNNYEENWLVNSVVVATANNNISKLKDIIFSTLINISLTESEIQQYRNSNIRTYRISLTNFTPGRSPKYYHFRSSFTILSVKEIITRIIPRNTINFNVTNGFDRTNGQELIRCYNHQNGHDKCVFVTEKDNFISAKYPLLFDNEASSPNTKDITDYLSKSPWYDEGMSGYEGADLICDIDKLIPNEIEFRFHFKNIYSLEELSKINEYKVEPIIK